MLEQTPSPKQAKLSDVGLEFLRHRDHWLFVALSFGLLVGLVVTGPNYWDLVWWLAGWLFFLPQEYLTHVYVLHCPLPKSERLYSWLYRLHYGHHDAPKRHDLMYMPLWLTLPMMVLNLVLIWLLTPHLRAFAAAYGGALVGYLIFEWSHLLSHVPYTPKTELWRQAKRAHMLHHHFNEARWFMVTPMWDMNRSRLKTPRSNSCKCLGLDENHPWIASARTRFLAKSSGNATCSRLWIKNQNRNE